MEIRRPDFDGRDFEALILITNQEITFCNICEYDKIKGLGVVYRVNFTSVSKLVGDYWAPAGDEDKAEKILKLTNSYYHYMNCKLHPYLIEDELTSNY